MGIEKFFNSLRKQYQIVKDTVYPYKKIDTKHLFFDFNSIVHTTSQRVIHDINKLLELYLIGRDKEGIDKLVKKYDLELDIRLDLSDQKLIDKFNEHFTLEKMNGLIIDNVLDNVLFIVKNNFNAKRLETVHIAIDGTPSLAKIMEQKKRRYMGNFMGKMVKKLMEPFEKEMSKGHKWKYENGKIKWSKNNISPGTAFMDLLVSSLKSKEYHNKMKNVANNLKTFIVSGAYESGEGEKKIVDYINDPKNRITTDTTIYSPDSDVILLAMLLHDTSNVVILRQDQQASAKLEKPGKFHFAYNIIDVDKLEDVISEYVIKSVDRMEKKQILHDIVFIFTIFGDDFLPRVESYDVRNDIQLITNVYIKSLKHSGSSYLVKRINNKFTLNTGLFYDIMTLLGKNEVDILKRNYVKNEFHNYRRMRKSVNKYLSRNNIGRYGEVDHSNIMQFIGDYNFSRDWDEFGKLLKKGITNIKSFHPLMFADFDNKLKKKTGMSKGEVVSYYKKNGKLPKIKGYLYHTRDFPVIHRTKNGTQYTQLLPHSKTLNNRFHQERTEGMDKYRKKLYQFEKMLDEFRESLNVSSNVELGKDIESIGRFYKEYLHVEDYQQDRLNDKMKKVIYEYLKGMVWIMEYYYNGISYPTWFYPYKRSPLMMHVMLYLKKEVDDKDKFFRNIQKELEQKHTIKEEDFFTPLEQLLYITPFDATTFKKDKNNIYLLKGFLTDDMIVKVEKFILSEFGKDFYFSVAEIVDKVYQGKKTDLIDCRDVAYVNKCLITPLEKNESIPITDFISQFREHLSFEDQQVLFDGNLNEVIRGSRILDPDITHYVVGYQKYKERYLVTNDPQYKAKYKRYKYRLKEVL